MSEFPKYDTLLQKIRSEISGYGQSLVARKDWLALCCNDLSFLGAIAARENWNYELVGDTMMRFTSTVRQGNRTEEIAGEF